MYDSRYFATYWRWLTLTDPYTVDQSYRGRSLCILRPVRSFSRTCLIGGNGRASEVCFPNSQQHLDLICHTDFPKSGKSAYHQTYRIGPPNHTFRSLFASATLKDGYSDARSRRNVDSVKRLHLGIFPFWNTNHPHSTFHYNLPDSWSVSGLLTCHLALLAHHFISFQIEESAERYGIQYQRDPNVLGWVLMRVAARQETFLLDSVGSSILICRSVSLLLGT